MEHVAACGVENRHVALIGWRIANVPACHGQDAAPEIAERRRDLLALRKTRNRRAPRGMAVGNRKLLDMSIRRGRINELAAGVGRRRGVGDLADPDQASNPGGVNVHNTMPLSASSAIVLP